MYRVTKKICNNQKCIQVAQSKTFFTPPSIFFKKNKDDLLQQSSVPTMHFQKSLPRLSIPKLEVTTSRYLKAQKPLLTPEEYSKTRTIANNFLGCEGRALHAELQEIDKANKETSYISEPWFDMYLKYRDSIVLNHNPFIMSTDDPNTTDQLTRATKLIHASLRFKRSLDENLLEPDVYHLNPKKSDTKLFRRVVRNVPGILSWYAAYLFKAFPLDMSQYKRLFNSTRVPKKGKDILKTDMRNKNVLVIRNGNIFLFEAFKKNGLLISRQDIHANLTAIMKASNDMVPHPLAVLTAEPRDIWAATREHLEKNEVNKQLLDKLDGAIFGIFLDDKDCLTENDAAEIFLHGEGHSRWFDKSVHLAISKNAKMAINFEHSWGDGVAVVRFLNEIVDASSKDTYKPTENNESIITVQKLDFQLDSTVKAAIEKAQTVFDERISLLRVNAEKLDLYGKNYLKTKKLSPDAIMQLAFQIAYFRMHGKNAATYESCSTAAFKHGRTETLRSCTIATAACAEAFELDNPANVDDMQRLLKESSDMHGQLTKDAAMGQGFDRHLFALKYLAERTGRQCEFFQDEAYKNLNHIIISTSTVGSPHIQMGGFAPVVPDGLGVGYMVNDDWLGCNTSSYPDSPNAKEFVDNVMTSLTDIHTVLEGKNFKK